MAASKGLTVSPDKIKFKKEVFGVTGATSPTKTVKISNPKDGATVTELTSQITGANPGDFSSTTNCTATLSPGSGCDVTLTFTPTALGSRSASLVIGDSADATLKSIALTGTGVAGKIAIKPSSLSFGKVAVDTASSAKTVTVSNPDSVALAITSITPSGPFSITTNSCDSSLAASSNCQVSVTFNPVSASKSRGTKVSGSLEIADDALKSPQKVKLSGVAFGTAVTSPTPTATATTTMTATPTSTATSTATRTATPTATATATLTATPTLTITATPSMTPTSSSTMTATPTISATPSPTGTSSSSMTPSPTPSPNILNIYGPVLN
ncbi:choice-of-anchor D domain-containing protein [Candidatus Binatus sp.]|uniref:choice-of-anchor D domain-containing protein n=1 Tax=Candidatus Binatus sp. TaxID=2811406 RepID=UPI003CC64A0C